MASSLLAGMLRAAAAPQGGLAAQLRAASEAAEAHAPAKAPSRKRRARATPSTRLRARTGQAPAGGSQPPMTLRRFIALPPWARPLLVVADGMGVDSTGMLEGLHRLGVRPDVILHAETGDEWPETIAFREERQRWLRSIGFPEFVMVRSNPSVSKVTGMPYSTLGEKCLAYESLPGQAFGKKSCSSEWKIRPQEAWLAKDPRAQALWARGGKVVKAIGYDYGYRDSRRAHQLRNDDHYEYVYPLREWQWDRARIKAELRAAGIPIPPKSACYFCPASKPWEIARLVRDHPVLADRIIAIEDAAQAGLRGIEGLWGRTVKGFRGAIPKPGAMAEFIRAVRRDPAMLDRYLAMEPPEEQYTGPVGGPPQFVDASGPVPAKRRLPLLEDTSPASSKGSAAAHVFQVSQLRGEDWIPVGSVEATRKTAAIAARRRWTGILKLEPGIIPQRV